MMILNNLCNEAEIENVTVNPEVTVEKANQFITEVKSFIPKLIDFGIKAVIALIIFIVGRFVIKFILKCIGRFFEKSKLDTGVRNFLNSFIKILLYIILLIIMLDTVGVKTTSFVAVLGTASLAIGLSLQGSLANFAGGVLILILKPFMIGDYIVVNSAGVEGTVNKIDIFYTTIISPDNKRIVIPNGNLSNSSIINCTALGKRRVDIKIGISYDSDIEKAKKIALDTVNQIDLVIEKENSFTFVESLDESQITIGIWAYCNSADYLKTKYLINEKVRMAYKKNDIEIPYNQLVVHMN
ncbi:small conductance mechanosensitive channel [Lachnospiraceae bacterium RM5]|nr:small conductance mechanosensitive channel [Lachnospiraceae bacterium RM5]